MCLKETKEDYMQCQNQSEDDSMFHITSMMLCGIIGTIQQFGVNGPVYVQSYSLIFLPYVRPGDQVTYYCCENQGDLAVGNTVITYVHRIK